MCMICVRVCIFSPCTQFGRTSLSLACEKGLADVAQVLINEGATLDVTDSVSVDDKDNFSLVVDVLIQLP